MAANFATPKTMTEDQHTVMSPVVASGDSKGPIETIEHVEKSTGNLEYNNDEEEPEIHLSTWTAVAAVCVSAFA